MERDINELAKKHIQVKEQLSDLRKEKSDFISKLRSLQEQTRSGKGKSKNYGNKLDNHLQCRPVNLWIQEYDSREKRITRHN